MDWRSQFEMFMPHGMCLLWRPELMSLHIISDAVVALAYFTIPFAILRFVRGRDDLENRHIGLAFLFASFIALCGLTHVLSIVVLWVPIYIIEGWIKAITAVVSLATAGLLIALVPFALKLPSVKAMELELEHRKTTLLLDAIIAIVPGPIYAKDGFGRILLANKGRTRSDWQTLGGSGGPMRLGLWIQAPVRRSRSLSTIPLKDLASISQQKCL